MNLRAVGAECRYILRIWTRSGSHIVMSMLMPVILLLALGFFFGAAGEDAPVLHVHDLDGSPAARGLVANLTAEGTLVVREGRAPVDANAWLPESGADALLRIPAGYGDDGGNTSGLDLTVADGESLSGRTVVAVLHRVLADPAPEPVAALAVTALPPAPTYRALLLPGVIGLSIVTTGVSVGFASISELRHAGLLQRLAASPLGKSEWLLGRMLGVGAASLVSVAFLVVVARLVFGPTFTIGVWTLPLVLGGTLVFAGLGTLLGLAVERPEAGAAVLNLVLLPLILLSGAFFDLSGSPAVLQWASLASPLTHLVDGLRADMLGAGDAAMPALAMLGFAALLLVGGARLIRWTERA